MVENIADRNLGVYIAFAAQLYAQLYAQLPTVALANTQDDTAGLVILHQQLVLSVLEEVLTVDRVVAVVTSGAAVLEHAAMPLIGIVVSGSGIHDASQSALPYQFDIVDEHVVLLAFNATHFCTATAGAASIAPTAVKVKSFFICSTPFFCFIREKTKTTTQNEVVRRLVTI